MKSKASLIILVIFCVIPLTSSLSINNSSLEATEETISYYNLIDSGIELTTEEKALLEQNQFVVLNRLGYDDLLSLYRWYWEKDLPIFISTDTLLQTWHLLFDKSLEKTEQFVFYPLLQTLTQQMSDRAMELFDTDERAKNTLIYNSVAAKLLNSSFSIPSEVIQNFMIH